MKPWKSVLLTSLVLGTLAGLPAAQGVSLKTDAVVLYGAASRCTQPAVVDLKEAAKKTPEYKTIKSHGLDRHSARYKLLAKAMMKRIKKAAKAVAEEEGRDLVVAKGDISDEKGLAVTNLTDKVVKKIEEDDDEG